MRACVHVSNYLEIRPAKFWKLIFQEAFRDDEALWLEEYAPALFAECRQAFNISGKLQEERCADRVFLHRVRKQQQIRPDVLFSWDSKYLIKTITEKEALCASHAASRCSTSQNHTAMDLWPLSSVGQCGPIPILLIALSVFDTGPEKGLHHQFDLKGSTRGRVAGEQEEVKKDQLDQGWVSSESPNGSKAKNHLGA